jgi:hypothetical protein
MEESNMVIERLQKYVEQDKTPEEVINRFKLGRICSKPLSKDAVAAELQETRFNSQFQSLIKNMEV